MKTRLWRIHLRAAVVTLAALWATTGCQFDKVVDIPIPQDPPQLFVECYLEDSLPPRLALTLTQGYFDSLSLTPVLSGTVYLEAPDGRRIYMLPGIQIDRERKKAYNWSATEPIYLHEGDVWKLTASDNAGHTLTGSTAVMHKTLIDSVTYRVRDNDTSAYIATWFKDTPGVTNFYRHIVNRDSLYDAATSNNAISDGYRDGQEIPIRTGYSLAIGDAVFVRFFSLEQGFYRFIQSVNEAQRNNGNPFAQPNRLQGTVQGGLGVFTTLVYDQRRFIIDKPLGKIL